MKFRIRKELWFGFSLMALIILTTLYWFPAPSKMESGHLGLLMLSLIVVAIMLGYPTAFAIYDRGDQEGVARAVLREIRVPGELLRPGDLLFFRQGGSAIGHVGIYLGEGKMIHASSQRRGVILTDLRQSYYQDTFVVAKRLLEVNP